MSNLATPTTQPTNHLTTHVHLSKKLDQLQEYSKQTNNSLTPYLYQSKRKNKSKIRQLPKQNHSALNYKPKSLSPSPLICLSLKVSCNFESICNEFRLNHKSNQNQKRNTKQIPITYWIESIENFIT